MTDGILERLMYQDGSCRDINLFGVTRSGAERLLAWIRTQFDSHVGDATTSEGEVEPLEEADIAASLRAGNTVHGYLEGRSVLFGHLQYFVLPSEEGECFVELTFFPQDLNTGETVGPFKAWVESALATAGGTGAIVRFENASFEPLWDRRAHGDVILAVRP